ncbi:MAG TPA: glycosyltransferase, partial [Polyangiaceae bacterium]|nr:glycosyltransferase [Polyangiaceae bacterium]
EVRAYAAGDPRVRLVTHARNRGKGAAVRSALAAARGDYCLVQDADLEYDAGDYPRLLAAAVAGKGAGAGAPAVFGTRFHGQRRPRGMRAAHYAANRLLTALANALYGLALTDEATCYKLVDTALLRSLDLGCDGFDFCPEVTAKLGLLGIPVVEVPIGYAARSVEEGKKIRWTDGIVAVKTLVALRLTHQTPSPQTGNTTMNSIIHRALSAGLFLASAGALASLAAACSDERPGEASEAAASSAAPPSVQGAGVMRLRSEVNGPVTRVELLDEGGGRVGTLELTTEGERHMGAALTLGERSTNLRWTERELTLSRGGADPFTFRAGEANGDDAQAALRDATDELKVVMGVAHHLGAFAPVPGGASAGKAPRLLFLGTADDDDRFEGNNWQWGTSQYSWQTAYNGSQNTAYTGCTSVYPSGGCATYQGAQMNTSCSTGTYYGASYTSCTTTIVPGSCAGTGNCPQ